MQAQACRSAKQLPCAATAITGHSRNSGTSARRCHLQIATNMNKLSVSDRWYGRWATMLSTSRPSIPYHFTCRSYNRGANATLFKMGEFKESVRLYSSPSKNKYCLKRLTKGQTTSHTRSGLESIREVVSGANETLFQSAAVLRDRFFQAAYAINEQIITKSAIPVQVSGGTCTIDNQVTIAAFTDVSNSNPKSKETEISSDSKTSETCAANIHVESGNSFLPLSHLSNVTVTDVKVKGWHKISGAIRQLPSPSFKMMSFVSKVKGKSSKREMDNFNNTNSAEKAESPETCTFKDTTKVYHIVNTEEKPVKEDKDLPEHDAYINGGLNNNQTVSKTNITKSAKDNRTESTFKVTDVNNTATAEQTQKKDSNFYRKVSALREKIPPISVPSMSVSDKPPCLSESTSSLRQKMISAKLTKWEKYSGEISSDRRGDFDLDSPHLHMTDAQHTYKDNLREATAIAEPLMESVDPVNERKVERNKAEKAKKTKKIFKLVVSKASIDNRTKTLAMGIKMSQSNSSSLIKLERLCNHLVQYPESTFTATRENLIPSLLKLRHKSKDKDLNAQVYKTLALLGHADPVKGRGIRILALDGGGCRGIVSIEALREIERRTNRDIRDMFDYMVGVSSGAVLAYLLSFVKASLDQCEELFRELGYAVFERNSIVGTSKLLLNHAYYDTDGWIKILKKHAVGESVLIDTAKNPSAPKVAAIANKINASSIKNFVFRNYHLPDGAQSQYQGSVKYRCWEALRASSAAPGYFEEFKLDENVFQDGGVLTNNPSAVGIHECCRLWPDTPIQCLVSLGTGHYEPVGQEYGTEYSSLRKKLITIMQSATETESVHTILQDLLPAGTYFRFNPIISEDFALDESRPEKLTHMQVEAQDYLANNRTKLDEVAQQLSLQKTVFQKAQDWVKLQQALYL